MRRRSSRRSSRSVIAESATDAGQLPPLARLALAYAPASTREDWLSLLLLDARLAGIVRAAREPMLAQLRLAWWRDRLAADPSGWPQGEPLLARIAAWGDRAKGLAALVDGWESLLGDAPLAQGALANFAQGRAGGLAALATRLGADAALVQGLALRWALADLALHLGDAEERKAALALLDAAPAFRAASAPLRPLAILAGLSDRAVRKGMAEALSGPSALLAAMRIGLLAR